MNIVFDKSFFYFYSILPSSKKGGYINWSLFFEYSFNKKKIIKGLQRYIIFH